MICIEETLSCWWLVVLKLGAVNAALVSAYVEFGNTMVILLVCIFVFLLIFL